MSGTKEARQEGIYCVWSSATGCYCILLPLTDGIFDEGWGNGGGVGGLGGLGGMSPTLGRVMSWQ